MAATTRIISVLTERGLLANVMRLLRQLVDRPFVKGRAKKAPVSPAPPSQPTELFLFPFRSSFLHFQATAPCLSALGDVPNFIRNVTKPRPDGYDVVTIFSQH